MIKRAPIQRFVAPARAIRKFAFGSQLAAVVVGLSVVSLALWLVLPDDGRLYIAPSIACAAVFATFWLALQRQVDDNILGELGLQYVGIILVYTLVPAASFMTAAFYQGGPLDQLLPNPIELRDHLWRQVVYEAGVAIGYLIFRGRQRWTPASKLSGIGQDRIALVVIAFLTIASVMTIRLLSAPVETYYDNYTRFDHLPWVLHKLASLCIRMSLGLYCLLLVFLFRNYKKYRLWIPFVVVGICGHEIVYSLGARIQAFLVLMQAVMLYHLTVKRISLKWSLVAVLVLMAIFSAIELVRLQDLTLTSARDVVSDDGLQPASELISVYFPSFHLYSERAAGTLPPREWPMFFSDFISLFTFGDFVRWNPMVWYANNYFPQADVLPFTLGPIADSAIWGGEIDLVIRALINGFFFAYLVRWFLRHGNRWWGMAIYVYCLSSAILTIKWSVFLDVGLVEKNLVPVLLVVQAARMLQTSISRDKATGRRALEPA